MPPPPSSTLFPYTTLFRSRCFHQLPEENLLKNRNHCNTYRSPDNHTLHPVRFHRSFHHLPHTTAPFRIWSIDRKSTRLNSSHVAISYAVFCLKKKKKITHT